MSGLVSVIIPTYNRGLLLKECLLSVYDQKYRPIEIIVVDDGSTDSTETIVQNFISKHFSLEFKVFFLKQTNKGAPAARNLGFKKSSGSYIQFLDSDDILLPEKFRVEVPFLADFDLVYSSAQFVDKNLNNIPGKWGEPLTRTYLDYFKFTWQTMCALYKREAVEQVGAWNENLIINQDWEYSIRCILTNINIKFIEVIHSLFRIHNEGNIGNGLRSLEKVKGKELSTILIRERVFNSGKLIDELDRLYMKRLIYCLLSYGALGSKSNKVRLGNYILNNFKINSLYRYFIKLLILTSSSIDKSILRAYHRVLSSK